jgi:hypothetical protein
LHVVEEDEKVLRMMRGDADAGIANTQLTAEGIADRCGLSATTVRTVRWLKPEALLRSDDLLRCGDVNMILLRPGRQVS